MSSWEAYSMDKNTQERNKFGKNRSDAEKEGVNLWVNPCVDSSQKDEEEMALDSPQDSDSINKSEDFKVKSFDLNLEWTLMHLSKLFVYIL
jgi:hypothetical protein